MLTQPIKGLTNTELTNTELTNGRLKAADGVERAVADAETDAYMAKFLHRTTLLLGEEAVRTLATKTVAIAGCGGVGGGVAITLARMGVGGFILADPGLFDEPDANRQWAANRTVFGRNKAEVYDEVLRSINPTVRISRFAEGVTATNFDAFLSGADVVIDCLDVGVTAELRAQVYRTARANGAHCLAAPMLGFGAVVAIGAPDGMPMEAVFGRTVEDAAARSQLPPGLQDHIVPEHLATVARHVGSHRVPSVAISPVLSTAILSTEVYLLLLGAGAPGWRPPHCLPEVFVFDPIRMTYKVVAIQDLLQAPSGETRPTAARNGRSPDANETHGSNGSNGSNGSHGSHDTSKTPDASPAREADAEQRRQAILQTVGRNTLLLPHDAIAVDLNSDSWSERPVAPSIASDHVDGTGQVDPMLRGLYGYKHAVPVFRGRFAEALLVKACIKPGGTVLTNALFPTTRFHLTSAGADVVEIGIPAADDLYDPHPFKGNIDLDALALALSGATGHDVRAVYVELCANATGGHPVSLANLQATHDLAAAHGVPVFLDATRAFENAVLVREREPGQSGKHLADIVRAMCACSDGCAASLTKDFVSPVGGFVGTNDGQTFVRLRDLALLAYGDGLRGPDRVTLARAMAVSPEGDDGPAGRTAVVRRLHAALTARSVPVLGPPGGHAVFVDAAAFLPHLGPDDHRATALANALFVAGGVRAGVNLGTPRQDAAGIDLLRLAVAVGGVSDADIDRVVEAFRRVHAERAGIGGLRRAEGIGGMVGAMAAEYRPVVTRGKGGAQAT